MLTEINRTAGVFDYATARKRADSLLAQQAFQEAGTVEEIAEGVDYRVRAEWTTGTILAVDGGLGLGILNA